MNERSAFLDRCVQYADKYGCTIMQAEAALLAEAAIERARPKPPSPLTPAAQAYLKTQTQAAIGDALRNAWNAFRSGAARKTRA